MNKKLIIGVVVVILVAALGGFFIGRLTSPINEPTSTTLDAPAGQSQQTTAMPTPTDTPTAPAAPASQLAVPAGQQAVSCPTEAEFAQLTGVVADVVPSEPCAFHWRGDPLAIMPKDACPNGWACQLGVVQHGNVLYYGGSPSVSIYAGTWRLPAAYPLDDAVQQPCLLLAKSQEEGKKARPTWSITAGNFSCP